MAKISEFMTVGEASVYPLFSLKRMIRWRRRRRRKQQGLCVDCGYDLTGNVSGVCSECGTEIGQP